MGHSQGSFGSLIHHVVICYFLFLNTLVSFLNLDISLMYFLEFMLIYFLNCGYEILKACFGLLPVSMFQDLLVYFLLSQPRRFKTFKRKSFVTFRRFCFLKFFDHLICSGVTLVASVTKYISQEVILLSFRQLT